MAWPRPYGMTSRPDDECHLVSENYAYALQLILGFSALAGLVVSAFFGELAYFFVHFSPCTFGGLVVVTMAVC